MLRGNLKTFCTIGVASTLAATAADLGLSASHGYFIRLDTTPLLLMELAGTGSVVLATLTGFVVEAWMIRRPEWVWKRPCGVGLACIASPITLALLWRHRELPFLMAIGAAAVLILAVLLLESRYSRPVIARAVSVGVVLASVGTLVWILTVPFPGRAALTAQLRAQSRPTATAEPRPNLLFVVLDTLRADHIGAYGYPRTTTPWIDEFATTATLFENVAASSSFTLPTHATLFTGLYPESHGAMESGTDEGVSLQDIKMNLDWAKVLPLSDEVTTLAEVLQTAGYDTAAMCANSGYLSRAFNLDQGFNTYIDTPGSSEVWRPFGLSLSRRLPGPGRWRVMRMLNSNERLYLLGGEINELASTWMATRNGAPYFLFLNYMEPHAPYLPAPAYRKMFPHSYDRITADVASFNRGEGDVSPEERDVIVDAYDAEVRSLDDRLRELFGRLERWGLLDDTYVVIVSDHGEGFGEHSRYDHAQTVYEQEVHVPLILRVPGQSSAQRIERRVHAADVFPTLLTKMGISFSSPVEGSDLFSENRSLPVVTYFGPYERTYSEHAIYEGDLKLILRDNGAPPELYDLAADPGELHNLATTREEAVERLTARLHEFQQRGGPRYRHGGVAMDSELQERLNSLGYGDK